MGFGVRIAHAANLTGSAAAFSIESIARHADSARAFLLIGFVAQVRPPRFRSLMRMDRTMYTTSTAAIEKPIIPSRGQL